MTSNSNSNSTFIALNLHQKTDSKAHHTKTLFNIQKPETLQGSAPRRKQKGDWKFRVGMLFQRGMTSVIGTYTMVLDMTFILTLSVQKASLTVT